MSALQAYRQAFRATKVAFKNDAKVLNAARAEIRRRTEENKHLVKEEADNAIKELSEVSKFLIQNIVQAEKTKDDRYFLHFHDKTELGDNETIKQNNRANMGSLAGAKVRRCK